MKSGASSVSGGNTIEGTFCLEIMSLGGTCMYMPVGVSLIYGLVYTTCTTPSCSLGRDA